MQKHPVIIVPGLGDDGRALEVATRFWKNHGLDPFIHVVGWEDGSLRFADKLEKLIRQIDLLARKGSPVSLVGCSAGGSAVLNAFLKRQEKVAAAVNVCGMVRRSRKEPETKFLERTRTSSRYRESVLLFERSEPLLKMEARNRVMTVRALFADQHIPEDTVALEGAHNTVIPSVRHVLSIALALTLFSRPLLDFVLESA